MSNGAGSDRRIRAWRVLHAIDRSHRRVQGAVQRGDGCTGGGLTCTADQGGVEDRVLRQVDVLAGVELGTDVIDVGDELATQLPDQIQ